MKGKSKWFLVFPASRWGCKTGKTEHWRPPWRCLL